VRAITTGASCEGGTADGYPCEDVDLVQYTPFSTVLATMNWGWTDPDSGGEWAIQASYSMVVFIYMGDAQGGGMSASIQYAMALHNGGGNTWSDVKTYGNWLLHGSEKAGHGVQILDLKKHLVPHSGSAIELQPDKWWGGFGDSHNLVVNEETSLAFGMDVAGGDLGWNFCGLYAFDIRDPMNPVAKGCLYSGSTHDAQCVLYRGPDEAYFGKEICFVYAGNSGLVILDITDLNNPKTVASISSYVNKAYTHQGWINCQHDTVFFGDEVDEMSNGGSKVRTFVVDVSTLSEPTIMNVHVSGVDSIDHNQYVCGGFVYQSNYESGLRILDGSQAQTNKAGKMTEVAYFDIFPDRDAVSFKGTWNVWPYFKSGRVIIGDIDGGLAVVRPTNLLKQARQRSVGIAGDGVCPILLEERACADLTPTKAPTAKPDAVEGDDPLLSSQTNNPAIDAAGAWAYGAGTPDVIVQVVDTGLQLSHEEHQVNVWQNPGEVPNNGLDDDNNGYVDDYNGCNHADNTCTQLLGDGGAQSHGTHC
jgi:choice-of-anchor B domain-containing protein